MDDYDDLYDCNQCGGPEGRCDCEADGYECGECGYVPTWAELQRGYCPGCAEARRAAREREAK
jgi:hypothetical protein